MPAPAPASAPPPARSTPPPQPKPPAVPSRDIGALDYLPLRELVLAKLEEERINSVTEEVFDVLSAAAEHRLRSILEDLISISKVRVDEGKQTFPFSVSSDPRRVLRQVERRERDEKKRREQEERERIEAERAEKDPKVERKKQELEAKLTNRTALEAVGHVRKKRVTTFGGLDTSLSFRRSGSLSGLKTSSDSSSADSPKPVIALPPSSIQAPQAKYQNRRVSHNDLLAFFETEPRPQRRDLDRLFAWELRMAAHKKATGRDRPSAF
eukprot:TRINITY_DN1243_c0_g1_i1.p1 TRINITY_DN1243_c0_g1~~TRINITY_DN1243_c0_g1_i1.p1  ORF type:complete len:285 (+),score=100.90 TRINITY_DN1243_c0_g1_i1:54-857(+)